MKLLTVPNFKLPIEITKFHVVDWYVLLSTLGDEILNYLKVKKQLVNNVDLENISYVNVGVITNKVTY